MLLKKSLIIPLLILPLWAKYTSTNKTLQNDKTVLFQESTPRDNLQIAVKNGAITLEINTPKSRRYKARTNHPEYFKYHIFLADVQAPKKYERSESFKCKEETTATINELFPDMTKNSCPLPTINLALFVRAFGAAECLVIGRTFGEEFALKTKEGSIARVTREVEETTLYDPIDEKQKPITKETFTVVEAFKNHQPLNISDEPLITIYRASNGIVAMTLSDGKKRLISHITDEHIETFVQAKETRPTALEHFNFSKEKITLSYISQNGDKQNGGKKQRLTITYEMAKKNIKTILKSPLSLFNPNSKSRLSERNIGLLRATKSDLYELKKVQMMGKTVDATWSNLIKKRAIKIEYMQKNTMRTRILLKEKGKGQQFYGIEGVFYLVSWMNRKGIDKKIFTFISGGGAKEVTMLKVGQNSYTMEKNKQPIYHFTIDDRGIVSQMTLAAYDKIITLESADTTTTLENKQYIQSLRTKYQIKELRATN